MEGMGSCGVSRGGRSGSRDTASSRSASAVLASTVPGR